MHTSFHRLAPPAGRVGWRHEAFAAHVQSLALAAAGDGAVPVEHVSVVVDDAQTLTLVLFHRGGPPDGDGLLEALLAAMQAQSSTLAGWQVAP